MFEGIDSIFIVPVLALILLALVIGTWKLSTRPPKVALLAIFRVLFYGSLVLIALFIGFVYLYYSGGGH
jgi:hypothetical protein